VVDSNRERGWGGTLEEGGMVAGIRMGIGERNRDRDGREE
jgi:hypothetical protein